MIRCQNCPRRYNLHVESGDKEAAARVAGWVVWEGATLGGAHVRRVYCPACAGREEAEEPRWDAQCHTCDAHASDADDYYDEPFTEDDARAWRQDHECEPDVELIKPEVVAARYERHRRSLAKAGAA